MTEGRNYVRLYVAIHQPGRRTPEEWAAEIRDYIAIRLDPAFECDVEVGIEEVA